jgi:hypothetical protein
MIDKMYDSAEGFAQALNKLVDKFEDEAGSVTRKTLIDLTEKIKKDTPRDTGRAAAGWLLTSDKPSEYVPPEGQYPLTTTNDPGPAGNWTWWIANNVEYIEPLEEGHSQQAPAGMVANALNAFDRLLSGQLKGKDTIK